VSEGAKSLFGFLEIFCFDEKVIDIRGINWQLG